MQDIREQLRRGDGLSEEVRSTLVGHETPELMRQFTARRKAAEERLEAGKTESLTITEARRIGRNDPCPCNSGAKFKHCCGCNFNASDKRLKD